MPVFVPKQEWLADLEEQAKRRLQQTMSGVGDAAQGFVQGAQDKIAQERADAEKAREEMYRGIFEREMAAVRERGQQALQGLQGVGQDLGAGVQQAQEAQAALDQTTQETTAREAAQPPQVTPPPTPEQPQVTPEPAPPEEPPPAPPRFQVPGLKAPENFDPTLGLGRPITVQGQFDPAASLPKVEGGFDPSKGPTQGIPTLPAPPEDANLVQRTAVSNANSLIESANRLGLPEERAKTAEQIAQTGRYLTAGMTPTGQEVPLPVAGPRTAEDTLQERRDILRETEPEDILGTVQAAGDVASLVPLPAEQLENVAFAGAQEVLKDADVPDPWRTGASMVASGLAGVSPSLIRAGGRFVAPRPRSSQVDGAVPRPEGPTARDTRGVLPHAGASVPTDPGYSYLPMTGDWLESLRRTNGTISAGVLAQDDATLASALTPRSEPTAPGQPGGFRSTVIRFPKDATRKGVWDPGTGTNEPASFTNRDLTLDDFEIYGDDGQWHTARQVMERPDYGVPTREMGGGPSEQGPVTPAQPVPPDPFQRPPNAEMGRRRRAGAEELGVDVSHLSDEDLGAMDYADWTEEISRQRRDLDAGMRESQQRISDEDRPLPGQPEPSDDDLQRAADELFGRSERVEDVFPEEGLARPGTGPGWDQPPPDAAPMAPGDEGRAAEAAEGFIQGHARDEAEWNLLEGMTPEERLDYFRGRKHDPSLSPQERGLARLGEAEEEGLWNMDLEDADPTDVGNWSDQEWDSYLDSRRRIRQQPDDEWLAAEGQPVDPRTVQYRRGIARAAGVDVSDLSDEDVARMDPGQWQTEVNRRRNQPPEAPGEGFVPDSAPPSGRTPEENEALGKQRRIESEAAGWDMQMSDSDLGAMPDEVWEEHRRLYGMTPEEHDAYFYGGSDFPGQDLSPEMQAFERLGRDRRTRARAEGLEVDWLADDELGRLGEDDFQRMLREPGYRPFVDPRFRTTGEQAEPPSGMTEVPGEEVGPQATRPDRPNLPFNRDDPFSERIDVFEQLSPGEQQAVTDAMASGELTRNSTVGEVFDWIDQNFLSRRGDTGPIDVSGRVTQDHLDAWADQLRANGIDPDTDPEFQDVRRAFERARREAAGQDPLADMTVDEALDAAGDLQDEGVSRPNSYRAAASNLGTNLNEYTDADLQRMQWEEIRDVLLGKTSGEPPPPSGETIDIPEGMIGPGSPDTEALGRLRREEAIRQGFGPEDLSDLDDAAIGRLTHDEWEAFQTAREAEIGNHFAAGGTLEEWTGPPSDQPRGPLEGTREMGPRDLRPEGQPPPEGPVRGMPPTPADPDYPFGGPIDLGPERRNVAGTGGPSSPLDGAAAGRRRTPVEAQPGFGGEFLTRLGPASVRSGAAGGVLGGATGAATAPEDATWEERLQRGVVWGAGGAALAGGGRYLGSQALLGLAEEGRAGLRPETFISHPDFSNRVRAMMLAAADATPEGQLVRTPALLDFLRRFDLTRARGGDEVQALLKGGLYPDEVREIVASQAPSDKVWAAGQQWLVDLLSGTGMGRLRRMEGVGDVGSVRAMPLGAERGSGYRSGVRAGSPEGLQAMVDQVARRLGVDRPLKVFVTDSKAPEAMAGIAADEGGDILVSQGFVDLLKAGHIPEEQALGVLAHEVGHFLPGGLSDTPIDRALRAYDRTRDRLLGPPSGSYRGAAETGGTDGTRPPGRPRETFPESVGPPAREPVDYEGRAVHPDDLPPDLVAEEAQQLSRAYATTINDIRAAADKLPAGDQKDALIALANKMRQDYIGGIMGRLSPEEKARQNKLENLRRQGRGTTQTPPTTPPQTPQQPTPPQGQQGQAPPAPPPAPPGQTGTPPPVTTRGQGTTPTTGQTPATTPTTGPATAPPPPALDPVGFWDWVAQARYSGLLSNIYGIMGDFISGPIEGVWKLARDATMETAGAVTGRGGRPGAVLAETKAVIDVAFPEMIRLFPTIRRELGTPLSTGVGNVNPVTGLPQRTASTGSSDVGRDLVRRLRANNQRGVGAATAMEMPSRARAAIDAVNSQVAHKMSLARQAYHDVADQGIDPWSARGKAAREQVMQNPTQAMIDTAIEDADRLTFRNDPGAFGDLLANAAHHPLGNLLMPIVRTPFNIAQRGMERTPLGLVGIARDLSTGTGPLRQRWANVERGDERLTDVILGTSLWLGLAAAAEAGLITGTGPDDARTRDVLRAQGWRPNSIKVGDRYVSYERIGPFAFPLALAGAYGDSYQSRRAGTGRFDSDLWMDVMQNAGYWGRNQTFLRSFGDVYESLGDFKTEAPRWASNTALAYGSLVTGGLMSGVASALDPYERRRDVQPHEYPGGAVTAEVAYRLPALRETLPVRRDVFGERMQNPGHGIGFVAPLRGGPHRSTINRDTRSLRRYEDSRSALQDLRITRAKQAVEDFEAGRSARRPSASEERMADDYSESADYEAALQAAREAEIERNLARSGR